MCEMFWTLIQQNNICKHSCMHHAFAITSTFLCRLLILTRDLVLIFRPQQGHLKSSILKKTAQKLHRLYPWAYRFAFPNLFSALIREQIPLHCGGINISPLEFLVFYWELGIAILAEYPVIVNFDCQAATFQADSNSIVYYLFFHLKLHILSNIYT